MNNISRITTSIDRYKIIILIQLLITPGIIRLNAYAQQSKLNPNGYNVFYYENGNISSEGNMKDGKPEGIWKTYYENGTLKSVGNRKNHELEGVWKFYNKDGVLASEITYRHGKKNGAAIFYNIQGFIVKKEQYENDMKEGMSILYYDQNNIIHEKIPMHNNKEEGVAYEYAKDGRIITITKYKNGFVQRKEQINRKDANGMKQGLWKWFWDEDGIIVRLEGRYKDDKKEGYFREYDKQGKLLNTTKYEKGKIIENAEELENLEMRSTFYEDGKLKTLGSYKNGKPEGVTRKYDKHGKIIDSWIYKDGILLGQGVLNEKGMKTGHWKEYYRDGTLKAEGNYKNGYKTGNWVFYHQNGHVAQTGAYTKGGKPDGKWIWYFQNDSIRRIEYYKKGLEDGPMIEYNDSGKVVAKGQYIDGEKEGEWYFETGDDRELGSYKADRMDGMWKFYYPNDKLSFEGEFIEGIPYGKHTYYYKNGKKMLEGKYSGGKKDGDWKRYNDYGELLLTIKYKNGIEKKVDGVKIKPATNTSE